MPTMADLRTLRDTDLQRAVLETFVVLAKTNARFQGWTHVRCERRDYNIRWQLLDADVDSVRRETDLFMGSEADDAMRALTEPFVRGQFWELCRVSIRFHPPRMTIDVLADSNTVVLSGELIDLHLEEQVRDQLALMIGR